MRTLIASISTTIINMQLHPELSSRFGYTLSEQRELFKQVLFQCQTASRQFSPGDIMLQQGQNVRELYVVSVGKVAMYTSAHNGRRFQLGELNCDQHIFGEIEFFTKLPCQWTVMAEDQMEAEVICAAKLQQCIVTQPQLALFFASALAWDYQDSMAIYTNRLLHPIAVNIALDLLQRSQNNLALGAFNKVEQEAERFGTSSRVYRRALNSLIELGLVEKRDQQVHIIDPKALVTFIAE